MLSASTAQLVDGVAVLGEVELVQIKGAEEPVAARRLLGMGDQHRAISRAESKLVGRRWEMSAVDALLERAVAGQGAVVTVVGPPGIGKSRLVREVCAGADVRGVDVFTAFCESHTRQVSFHAVARLLRAVTGSRVLTRMPPERAYGLSFPMQSRRTCCSLTTCWAPPIPMWSCPRSIRMPVGGG
jgi:hypothetical protein